MSQTQIYLLDTYRGEITTRILSSGKEGARPWIALEDNIFHPQGGGQPSDRGWIGTIPVVAQRLPTIADLVLVTAADDTAQTALAHLTEGTTVTATIDLPQRLANAALHTAGHLINATAGRRGLTYAGCNHFPGQARVEFQPSGPVDSAAIQRDIESAIRDLIADDRPVHASASGDGPRTLVIDGLCEDSCAGTHVARLGLLSDFQIRSVKVKGDRVRVGYDVAHAGLVA
ncbi:MAG: hypothetical protein F8N37_09700 [Telmatospirillum sp.]|nr:hypothetical protein [Telmatospirillum sp.]